jgi:SAM-dependent methyltransferase
MKWNFEKYIDPEKPQLIVDIGARDWAKKGCGTYKYFIKGHDYALSDKWEYLGVDVDAGINVDVVMPDPFTIPLETDSADVVISGQCFEHCENPFKLMAEMARICKPGGYVFVVAPFRCNEHKRPLDCWRFLPDGWRSLFRESGLTCLEAYLMTVGETGEDCWGIACKPGENRKPK